VTRNVAENWKCCGQDLLAQVAACSDKDLPQWEHSPRAKAGSSSTSVSKDEATPESRRRHLPELLSIASRTGQANALAGFTIVYSSAALRLSELSAEHEGAESTGFP